MNMCCFSPLKQVKGVSQNINYTTIALLPVLTSLFDHIAQHQFGDDVIRKCSHIWAISDFTRCVFILLS